MMGQHTRSEALFYYFRLEDQVPETHLLRLIEKHISFAFVREKLKESYSEIGRPSIDPELLLRILLVTRRNHGKRSTFLWYSLAAVLVFGASKLQMSENKGVNPLGLAFDWVYTPRP